MKNVKRIGLTLSLFALVGAFAACGDGSKVTLPSPELTFADDGIYWAEIQGATGYTYRLNEGSWQTAGESVAYPTTVGEYTLEIKAEGGDAMTTEVSFSVKVAEVSAQTVGNVVTFTGENISYSVNDGEEATVENGELDFSAAQVGTQFSVTYYTKGGFWNETEQAYYIDGEKKSVSLTVTQPLETPVLTASADAIDWEAIENATAYEVRVDGELVETSETEIAYPTTAGTHEITVVAVGGGGYTNSAPAVFEMTTAQAVCPQVTYYAESGKVVWSEMYDGLTYASTGGEFTLVEGNELSVSAGLKIKIAAHYDAASATYYPESKVLAFEARAIPETVFDPAGKITWNESDEGNAKTYYVSVKTEGEAFNATASNELDLSNLTPGTYSFRVYASDYLNETETEATMYLPSSVAEFAFTVLEPVKLSFATNTLLWTVDELAYAYEYKIGDGEWTLATEDGKNTVTDMVTCYVRAKGGNDEDKFVVNGKEASIYFDPSLEKSDVGIDTLATFNKAGYAANIVKPDNGNATATGKGEVVTTSTDADESEILAGANGGVWKITAGSAGGRNKNLWRNSDGSKFNFFAPTAAELGAKVVFRLYMKSNPDRVNATWTDNGVEKTENLEGKIILGVGGVNRVTGTGSYSNESWATVETDKWIEVAVTLSVYYVGGTDQWGNEYDGFSNVSYAFVEFQNNGEEGDVIYVDEIRYENVKANTYEIDVDKNELHAKLFSAKPAVQIVDDETLEKKVVKIAGVWKADGLFVKYNSLEVPAGSEMKITMRVETTATNGGGIDVNGAYKLTFEKDATWQTYSISFAEDTVLTELKFAGYSPSVTYDFYFSSIVIEVPKVLQIDYTDLDVSKTPDAFLAFSAKSTPEIAFDETLQKNVVKFASVWKQDGAFVNYPSLTLAAGTTIKVTMKCTSSAGNGGGIYLNGLTTWKANFANDNTWATISLTFAEETTLTSLGFIGYAPNFGYEICIASIVIEVPAA